MAKPKPERSPLQLAAERLDDALAEHARATRELLKLELTSRKNVARAAEAIARLAVHEDELAEGMKHLGAVLARARDAQQAEAEQAQARAAEVVARKAALERLL